MNEHRESSFKETQWDNGHSACRCLYVQENAKQHKTHDHKSNHPRTTPRQLVAAKTQSHQLQRNGRDEQNGAAKVDSLPDQIESTVERRGDAWWIGENSGAEHKREHGAGYLGDEAPAPTDCVGNAATEGSAGDCAKPHDAVLHGLVHSTLAKGNEVRVDDCR